MPGRVHEVHTADVDLHVLHLPLQHGAVVRGVRPPIIRVMDRCYVAHLEALRVGPAGLEGWAVDSFA